MSDQPVKHSRSAPIIPRLPEIERHPRRRASSSSLRDRSRREVVIHQNNPSDSHLEHRNSEPRPIIMNDWIRMKIEVPKIYLSILYANMLASLFTWLLLAGFTVLPVTFASLRNSRAVSGIGKAGKTVFSAVQNIPFVWLAGTCFFGGVIGLSWLWWENRKNYIWLTDRVFLPALLNSLVGLVTTLVNVYTTQGGHWSVTAVVTATVTAFITLVTVTLYVLYALWTEPAWKEHCAMNRHHVL